MYSTDININPSASLVSWFIYFPTQPKVIFCTEYVTYAYHCMIHICIITGTTWTYPFNKTYVPTFCYINGNSLTFCTKLIHAKTSNILYNMMCLTMVHGQIWRSSLMTTTCIATVFMYYAMRVCTRAEYWPAFFFLSD